MARKKSGNKQDQVQNTEETMTGMEQTQPETMEATDQSAGFEIEEQPMAASQPSEEPEPQQDEPKVEEPVKSEPVEPSQPTKSAKTSQPSKSASTKTSTTTQKRISSLSVEGVKRDLDEYASSMGSNANLEMDDIVRYQMRLRSAINNLLNLEGDEFDRAMKQTLEFIRTHRNTLFAANNLFRGFPQLKLSSRELKRFEHLLNLLVSAADQQNPRNVTKVVDLNVVFRYVTDNAHQQKLTNFFSES